MTQFTVLNLPTFTDPRGSLTVVQRSLPFDVVRMYWIYGADGQTRGGHRHSHTRQVEPKDWHTMTFGEGAVLMIMSSHPYDRSEYIDTPYE